MAQYATNTCPLNGLALRALITAAAGVANGDTCATGTGTFLVVENTGAGACVVTIASPGTYEGDLTPLPSRNSVSVPITNGLNVVPLTDAHRDPSTGLATLTFSATAGVKAIVVRVP